MRFTAYLLKALKENLRDWKILMFVLAFAPCFIFILYATFGSTNHSFSIALINNDTKGNHIYSSEFINILENSKYDAKTPRYKITYYDNIEEPIKKLKSKQIDALAVFGEDFSQVIEEAALSNEYTPTKFELYGDPRNTRYSIAAIMLLTDLDEYLRDKTNVKTLYELDEILIGNGKALTDFDFYVPGIIVMSLLNVLFPAGASLIKEIEKGTIQRLIMSKLRTSELLSAISVTQILLCIVSLLLTLAAAVACGFDFHGSVAALLVVGALSGIGILGLAMLTVSFLKSVYDLMTVGVIPYFIVMFLSGIFFPLPPIQIASIAGNAIKLNDLLPLSLSVTAFNKILNFGAGLQDLGFEIIGIILVSMMYCIIGFMLFRHRHMRLQ